jgi:hypothetical protein
LILATLTESEIHDLSAASRGVPQIAPRLLAWIDGAYDVLPEFRNGLKIE